MNIRAFSLSPGGRFLLWRQKKGEAYQFRVTDVLSGGVRAVRACSYTDKLIQWSPSGKAALMLADNGPRSPYYLIDMASGRTANVPTELGRIQLAALWNTKGDRLFVSSVPLGEVPAIGELVIHQSPGFRTLFGNGATTWTPIGLDGNHLSTTDRKILRTVQQFYRLDRTFSFRQSFMPFVMSSDGDRALYLGGAFHRDSPDWASPDRQSFLSVRRGVPKKGDIHLAVAKEWNSLLMPDRDDQTVLMTNHSVKWLDPMSGRIISRDLQRVYKNAFTLIP